METIKIERNGILEVELQNFKGEPTGESIYFDMEDIQLPFKIQNAIELHKKNVMALKNRIVIADKKEEHKGKKFMSSREEEKMNAFIQYYKDEEEVIDSFCGKGATKKFLNGREPYYSMYEDIDKWLTPIMPKLKGITDNAINRIKTKYSEKKEDNVIE